MPRLLFLILVLASSACSSLPDVESVTMGEERYSYALAGEGKPAIVLISGFAANMSSWINIYPQLSQQRTTFAYDRPGYGDSKNIKNENTETLKGLGTTAADILLPGSGTVFDVADSAIHTAAEIEPRDGAAVIAELRTLLARLDLSPPYILIGHSLGTLYAEVYAHQFPEEIAGMVLIDPRPAGFTLKCQHSYPDEKCDIPAWFIKILPDEMHAEYLGMAATEILVQNATAIYQIPVTVLSSGKLDWLDSDAARTEFRTMQKAISDRSRSGKFIKVTDSGHFIQKDRPEVVIEAVKNMLNTINTSSMEQRHEQSDTN